MDRWKTQERGWWHPLIVGPWDLGVNRVSSKGKVIATRSCGNDNEQAKHKNGHGSNKNEGKKVSQ